MSKPQPIKIPTPLSTSLEAQRIKYDALIESIGEGLIVIDQSGNIEQANSYAASALGYAEAELSGAWFPAAVVMVDEYGEAIDPMSRPMPRALTEGKAITEYAHFLRKDGSILPVLLTASPIIVAGRPVGAIEIFRDLSRERELDAAKDEFVSIASHQLRTPATAIRGILSMLVKGDFGALSVAQQRYIELAIRSSDRQLDIIEDLLSVAQADAGRLDLSLAEINLSSLVSEMISEHQLVLAGQNQHLLAELEPGIITIIDSEKVKMVVDNLMSNASKYTPSGGTIKIELYAHDDYAHIAVQDNGVGIPEDKLDSIFGKFARVDNALSTPAGGTGLGLYLAKKIAKLHRGDISATSQMGQGSRFLLQLPMKKGERK